MAVTINGTTGVSAVQDGVVQTADLANDAVTTAKLADSVNLGTRNLLINGDMKIAQRARTLTGINSGYGNGYWTLDRWGIASRAGTAFDGTYEQYIASPGGSTPRDTGTDRALRWNTTTALSTLNADDYQVFYQHIDPETIQHLSYGNGQAKNLTLSFWSFSSIANLTVSVQFLNRSNNSADGFMRRNINKFTHNTASVWEYKTITIPGDTLQEIDNSYIDRQPFFSVEFAIAAGTNRQAQATDGFVEGTWYSDTVRSAAHIMHPDTTNFVATNGGNFYITAVQLEVGDTATPFEKKTYSQDLLECQRYFVTTNPDRLTSDRVGTAQSTYIMGTGYNQRARYTYYYPTTMRVKPSVSVIDAAGNGHVAVWHGATRIDYTGNWTAETTLVACSYYTDTSPGSTINGKGMMSYMGDPSSNYNHYLEISAEI